MSRRLLVGLLLVAGVLPGACGREVDDSVRSAKDGDTVVVDMTDNHYALRRLTVPHGATIHFEFRNLGRVGHEAIIGDEAVQAAAQRRDPTVETPENFVEVPRNEAGQLTYRFDTPGVVIVGCHQPNHYSSGMHFTVEVT
jgi:uncharacterized cupredoxin-like copper-binding protein